MKNSPNWLFFVFSRLFYYKTSVRLVRHFQGQGTQAIRIGHLKGDERIDRNYLRGVEGDRMNALMAGIGFNLRKLLGWIIFVLNYLISAAVIWQLGMRFRLCMGNSMR